MTTTDPLRPWPDTVDWRPISTRQIWLEEFILAATTAGVLAVTALIWWLTDTTAVWFVAAALTAVAGIRAAIIIGAVRSWGYAERDVDLLVRHGRLIRRLSIIPYTRMQFVDVTRGPLQRLLGLSTVRMHTAAAASDARVPGLPPAEATRLRDRLTALGEARTEGL